MKLHIGLGELMDIIVRSTRKKDELKGIKVRKVLTSLKNPDNSKFHARSDRVTDVKSYLNWERKEIGLIVD